HPGLAEDPVVVGHRRLRDAQLDRAAGTRARRVGQPPDDLEPLRVAERVQNGRQLQLFPIGVMKLHSLALHCTTSVELVWYDAHRTNEPTEGQRWVFWRAWTQRK